MTGAYAYDSLNRRVRGQTAGGSAEFVFDQYGRRVSTWNGSTHASTEANIYSDSGPVAIRTGGSTHFEHQNWVGTERLRTAYNGAVETQFTSLPWGDGSSTTGTDSDPYDFAGLDRDQEDLSEHAQFRNYSPAQGRWLSPDPFYGSYDLTNPQSFNRYAYALNNPVNFVDPSGLGCEDGRETDGDDDDGTCDGGQDGGGSGDGGSIDAGSDGTNGGSPAPGSIFYDENGNAYMVGSNGQLIPLAGLFSYVGGDGGCYAGQACMSLLSLAYGASLDGPTPDYVVNPQYNEGKKNPFICGSEAAGKVSAAGALQHFFPSLNNGVGGFITNALGGNAFSGATDLIHSFATGEGGGHSVFYNMGQGVVAGPTQGFGAAFGKAIEGTPFASGPVDAVMAGVLGEYATGVGEAKLIYDGVTYVGAVGGCLAGVIH